VDYLCKNIVAAPCLRPGFQNIARMLAAVLCLKQRWRQRAIRLSDAYGMCMQAVTHLAKITHGACGDY